MRSEVQLLLVAANKERYNYLNQAQKRVILCASTRVLLYPLIELTLQSFLLFDSVPTYLQSTKHRPSTKYVAHHNNTQCTLSSALYPSPSSSELIPSKANRLSSLIPTIARFDIQNRKWIILGSYAPPVTAIPTPTADQAEDVDMDRSAGRCRWPQNDHSLVA